MMEIILAYIPPNARRVGYIDPIHGLTYTPTLIKVVGYLNQFVRCASAHVQDYCFSGQKGKIIALYFWSNIRFCHPPLPKKVLNDSEDSKKIVGLPKFLVFYQTVKRSNTSLRIFHDYLFTG